VTCEGDKLDETATATNANSISIAVGKPVVLYRIGAIRMKPILQHVQLRNSKLSSNIGVLFPTRSVARDNQP
jgi:hypothetical protein